MAVAPIVSYICTFSSVDELFGRMRDVSLLDKVVAGRVLGGFKSPVSFSLSVSVCVPLSL